MSNGWPAPSVRGAAPAAAASMPQPNYIAERFEGLGLPRRRRPGARGDDRYFQPFTMTGETGAPLPARNVIGVLPGTNPALNGQALIVSAHYDHLGLGWPMCALAPKGNSTRAPTTTHRASR